MSLALVLNSSNVSNATTKSTYTYNFIQGSLEITDGSTITINDMTIPYSFFNITTNYLNQVFQIVWVDATVYTITITAGFYLISDINDFLVNYCITNGLYLLDSNGDYITYISLIYNSTYYAVGVNCYLVPTSLPAGYTNPGGMVYATGSPTTPQLYIPSTSNFGLLLGLPNATYFPSSPSASNTTQLSTSTPIGSNINSIICRVNLADNNCSIPSDVVGSFPINATFGCNITFSPAFETKVALKRGRYSQMVVSLVDQNFQPIYMNDSNVLMTFLININKDKK